MLQTIEINPKSPPQASIIWLHGLGASGHDFVDIVPELNLPSDFNIHFIFPHAPERAVAYANNTKMKAWFNVIDLNPNTKEDEIGIKESEKLINELISV